MTTTARVLLLLAVLIAVVKGDVVTITKEFFSNYFSDVDTSLWTVSGNNAPTSFQQSSCNSQLLFGGYGLFVGDQTAPVSISRTYPTAAPHWSARVRARIYKIDSWNNETMFITVDGLTHKVITWNSSTFSQDLCGTPNPVIDYLNPSYADGFIDLDINITHTASTLTLGISTNINSWVQSWGIRNIQIDLDYCDRSCKSCDGPISGLVSTAVGAYFTCTCNAAYLTEKVVSCSTSQCFKCLAVCDSGYYANATSSTCISCHVSCATCTGPTNNVCGTCKPGYFMVSSACSNCFSDCAACNGLSATSCTACSGTRFLLTTNNSCVSQCPSRYYSSQTTNLCIPCDITCLTCNGGTSSYCTSCFAGRYLQNRQCVTACIPPAMAYPVTNQCVVVCPSGNFVYSFNNSCLACSTGCQYCTNLTYCLTCASGSFISGTVCATACPSMYFANSQTRICEQCSSNCLACTGPTNYECTSCVAGYYLFNNSCSLTCPSNSYTSVTICVACHSECLTCTGPLNTNCSSCSYNMLYHLNQSRCVENCDMVDVVDNSARKCWSCSSGLVAILEECQACDSSCLTCDDLTFQDCLSCPSGRSLSHGYCLCSFQTGLSSCPASVSTSYPDPATVVKVFIFMNLILCVVMQAFFKQGTNMFLMIDFLQVSSFLYYIDVKYLYNSQDFFNLILKSHPSVLIKFSPQQSHLLTDGRYALTGKTGIFWYDADMVLLLYTVICVIFALSAYLKYLSKNIARSYQQEEQDQEQASQTCPRFCYRVLKAVHQKLNPKAFNICFNLTLMQLILSYIMSIQYFSTPDTFVQQLSLAQMVIVGLLLLASLFWKVEDEQGFLHYSLLYNNDITYLGTRGKDSSSENGKTVQIGLKGVAPIISKIAIAILLPVYSKSPIIQSGLFLLVSCGKLIVQLTLEYRRKIYKLTVLVTNVFEILMGLMVCITVLANPWASLGVYWLCATCCVVLFVLSLCTAIVNWRLFPLALRYLYWHLLDLFCGLNSKGQNSED